MGELKLKIDPDSLTWRAVEEWIEHRLYVRRSNLEMSGQDLAETENARGAIEELLELRHLANPVTVLESPLLAEAEM